MNTAASIQQRYTKLSSTACCLSCGGAVHHAAAQPGEVCVDLGSGRGSDCILLANAVGGSGFVHGIDLTAGMLDIARQNARERDLSNVEFHQAFITALPLEDALAGLVVSNCTINHAADKGAVWAEVYRVLRPGGRFVVSDIYAVKPIPERYRNDPEAVAECWAGAVTREEYMETLERTGFSNLNVLEESEPYAKGQALIASFTIRGYKPLNRKEDP